MNVDNSEAQQGDLAQWRADMRSMMSDTALFLRDYQPKQVMLLLRKLDAHLAAMPAQDVNAELLGALKRALPLINERHLREHPFPLRCKPSTANEAPACPYRDARAAIDQAKKGVEG